MNTMHRSAAILILLLGACSAPGNADRDAILAKMHATWDRPDAALEAGPVVVVGEHAVADWTQGAMGGRALLRREHGEWITVLCAGDGIRNADGLVAAGVPRETAASLASQLGIAEREVSAGRLARMASFKGIVRMQQGGGHDASH